MPIMTYGGFKRMTGFCKTKIPKDVADTLESIKDNEEAVRVRWTVLAMHQPFCFHTDNISITLFSYPCAELWHSAGYGHVQADVGRGYPWPTHVHSQPGTLCGTNTSEFGAYQQ